MLVSNKTTIAFLKISKFAHASWIWYIWKHQRAQYWSVKRHYWVERDLEPFQTIIGPKFNCSNNRLREQSVAKIESAAEIQVLVSTVPCLLHHCGCCASCCARRKTLLQTQQPKDWLTFVADHVDKEKFCGQMKQIVTQEHLKSEGWLSWVFQQDSDPPHTTNEVKKQ